MLFSNKHKWVRIVDELSHVRERNHHPGGHCLSPHGTVRHGSATVRTGSPAAICPVLCPTRINLKSEAERQAKHLDTCILQHTYVRGDAILKKAQRTRKLALSFEGPFLVDRVVSDLLYVLRSKRKTFVAHYEQLKPYLSRKLPQWAVKMKKQMNM